MVLPRARAGSLGHIAIGWCRWHPTSPAHPLIFADPGCSSAGSASGCTWSSTPGTSGSSRRMCGRSRSSRSRQEHPASEIFPPAARSRSIQTPHTAVRSPLPLPHPVDPAERVCTRFRSTSGPLRRRMTRSAPDACLSVPAPALATTTSPPSSVTEGSTCHHHQNHDHRRRHHRHRAGTGSAERQTPGLCWMVEALTGSA